MSGLSRRGFLKIAGLSLGSLGFASLTPDEQPQELSLARCTAEAVPVLRAPDPQAEKVRTLGQDELVSIVERVQGGNRPEGNPRWLRLLDGFAHTAYLQEVQWQFQPVKYFLPEAGQLMEITVPFSEARLKPEKTAASLFRLYYQSVYWAREVRPDSEGRFWYGIRDDRSPSRYYVRAEHARAFLPEELAPIPSAVSSDEKRVEVDLARQRLTAWESQRNVFQADISSGAENAAGLSGGGRTITPKGNFRVFRKMPCQHLGHTGASHSVQEPFDLPGVPWVAYYQADSDGYAFHGAYWHNDFGRPHSHGCVNLRPEDARWLYRWLDPQTPLEMFPPEGQGTRVRIY
jgi:lipoprotein-anchoring transpeptidase ErfK/SrfK